MRIVVGISGGVDSALAAALLQERGFDVVGCFLKVDLTAYGPDAPVGIPTRRRRDLRLTACPWREDLPMAHRVAAHLNIPLIVKDVSVEYEREVLKPMIAAYQRGETPNPDTTCNRYVKFDALAAVARDAGADRIATGHYVRIKHPSFRAKREISQHGTAGHVELWRALDHAKDQSYFLWQLTQEQLAMCEFPIGEWRKDDVRAEAKRRGLPNWDRDSTSGVCFLGEVNLKEFLPSSALSPSPQRREGEQKGERSPATVITTTGNILGTIPHAEAFTIGQRVPIAGQPTPHYVVVTCPKSDLGQGGRRIVVSDTPDDPARYAKTLTTGPPHWIGDLPQRSPPLPEGEREGVRTLRCTARIRHRQEPVPCTISFFSPSRREGKWEGEGVRVHFDTPLTGVAPGQAVVFTDGDRVLGGAQILKS